MGFPAQIKSDVFNGGFLQVERYFFGRCFRMSFMPINKKSTVYEVASFLNSNGFSSVVKEFEGKSSLFRYFTSKRVGSVLSLKVKFIILFFYFI